MRLVDRFAASAVLVVPLLAGGVLERDPRASPFWSPTVSLLRGHSIVLHAIGAGRVEIAIDLIEGEEATRAFTFRPRWAEKRPTERDGLGYDRLGVSVGTFEHNARRTLPPGRHRMRVEAYAVRDEGEEPARGPFKDGVRVELRITPTYTAECGVFFSGPFPGATRDSIALGEFTLEIR